MAQDLGPLGSSRVAGVADVDSVGTARPLVEGELHLVARRLLHVLLGLTHDFSHMLADGLVPDSVWPLVRLRGASQHCTRVFFYLGGRTDGIRSL